MAVQRGSGRARRVPAAKGVARVQPRLGAQTDGRRGGQGGPGVGPASARFCRAAMAWLAALPGSLATACGVLRGEEGSTGGSYRAALLYGLLDSWARPVIGLLVLVGVDSRGTHKATTDKPTLLLSPTAWMRQDQPAIMDRRRATVEGVTKKMAPCPLNRQARSCVAGLPRSTGRAAGDAT